MPPLGHIKYYSCCYKLVTQNNYSIVFSDTTTVLIPMGVISIIAVLLLVFFKVVKHRCSPTKLCENETATQELVPAGSKQLDL